MKTSQFQFQISFLILMIFFLNSCCPSRECVQGEEFYSGTIVLQAKSDANKGIIKVKGSTEAVLYNHEGNDEFKLEDEVLFKLKTCPEADVASDIVRYDRQLVELVNDFDHLRLKWHYQFEHELNPVHRLGHILGASAGIVYTNNDSVDYFLIKSSDEDEDGNVFEVNYYLAPKKFKEKFEKFIISGQTFFFDEFERNPVLKTALDITNLGAINETELPNEFKVIKKILLDHKH